MAQAESGDGTSTRTPPYTSFQTVKTFLGELKEHGVPGRVDRSVLTRFSGAVGTQLTGALKFLQLINEHAVPTTWLREMVDAYETDTWKERLERLLRDNYGPVFSIDLESATPSQFNETFRAAYPAKDEVLRKCVTFFLNAVRETDIAISPRILKNTKPRAASGPRKPRQPKSAKPTIDPSSETGGGSGGSGPSPDVGEFRKSLLEKFPAFDPSWPDNIKAEWFKGFDQFMKMANNNGDQR